MIFDGHSDLLYDVTRRRLAGEKRVLERRHLRNLEAGGVEGLTLVGIQRRGVTLARMLRDLIDRNRQKQASSVHPEALTSRMWEYIIGKCNIPLDRRLSELSKKHINVLCATLTNDTYRIEGQSRFKDEFVTCGGVALSNINQNTLEAKKYPGLFFAGEVLDVDAITGGFNLQAAWSMGYVSAN